VRRRVCVIWRAGPRRLDDGSEKDVGEAVTMGQWRMVARRCFSPLIPAISQLIFGFPERSCSMPAVIFSAIEYCRSLLWNLPSDRWSGYLFMPSMPGGRVSSTPFEIVVAVNCAFYLTADRAELSDL